MRGLFFAGMRFEETTTLASTRRCRWQLRIGGRTQLNTGTIEEIDFKELSDGTLLEMIEDPRDTTKTCFAVYSNKLVLLANKFDYQGRVLVPPSRVHTDVEHVRLASGAMACGEIHDLIRDITNILADCLDLERDFRYLISAFAISTWLPEKLPVAPYLALVGPPSSGKTTAMRVLTSLCYRGLLTADISSSAFYDISHRFRPTILLDETLTAGRPRELMHLLKASNSPDCVSLRKDKARLAYGPKVFSWLELPHDQALNSRCIIVPMRRSSRTDLKHPRDPQVLADAREMRMRLLQFRFERFQNVSVKKIRSDARLSARSLDLYRALAIPVAENELFCKLLADLIVKQNEFQACVLSPEQAAVIRVLYNVIHEDPFPRGYTMRDLTIRLNSDLKDRGEPHGLEERKLGVILTSLSFANRSRENGGFVLWLDRSDRERIHKAPRDYGLEAPYGDSIETCRICAPSNVSALANPTRAQTAATPPVEPQMKTNDGYVDLD